MPRAYQEGFDWYGTYANQTKAKLHLACLGPIKKALTGTVPTGPTQAFLDIHSSAPCLLRVVVTLCMSVDAPTTMIIQIIFCVIDTYHGPVRRAK
jgi:hypothetical protein